MDNEEKEKLINTEEFGVVDKVHSEEKTKGIFRLAKSDDTAGYLPPF